MGRLSAGGPRGPAGRPGAALRRPGSSSSESSSVERIEELLAGVDDARLPYEAALSQADLGSARARARPHVGARPGPSAQSLAGHVDRLPDHLLLAILSHLDFSQRLVAVPLVCRRWADLARSPAPELWGAVDLDFAAQVERAVHEIESERRRAISAPVSAEEETRDFWESAEEPSLEFFSHGRPADAIREAEDVRDASPRPADSGLDAPLSGPAEEAVFGFEAPLDASANATTSGFEPPLDAPVEPPSEPASGTSPRDYGPSVLSTSREASVWRSLEDVPMTTITARTLGAFLVAMEERREGRRSLDQPRASGQAAHGRDLALPTAGADRHEGVVRTRNDVADEDDLERQPDGSRGVVPSLGDALDRQGQRGQRRRRGARARLERALGDALRDDEADRGSARRDGNEHEADGDDPPASSDGGTASPEAEASADDERPTARLLVSSASRRRRRSARPDLDLVENANLDAELPVVSATPTTPPSPADFVAGLSSTPATPPSPADPGASTPPLERELGASGPPPTPRRPPLFPHAAPPDDPLVAAPVSLLDPLSAPAPRPFAFAPSADLVRARLGGSSALGLFGEGRASNGSAGWGDRDAAESLIEVVRDSSEVHDAQTTSSSSSSTRLGRSQLPSQGASRERERSGPGRGAERRRRGPSTSLRDDDSRDAPLGLGAAPDADPRVASLGSPRLSDAFAATLRTSPVAGRTPPSPPPRTASTSALPSPDPSPPSSLAFAAGMSSSIFAASTPRASLAAQPNSLSEALASPLSRQPFARPTPPARPCPRVRSSALFPWLLRRGDGVRSLRLARSETLHAASATSTPRAFSTAGESPASGASRHPSSSLLFPSRNGFSSCAPLDSLQSSHDIPRLDGFLRLALALPRLESLVLEGCDDLLADRGLAPVAALPWLRHLDINSSLPATTLFQRVVVALDRPTGGVEVPRASKTSRAVAGKWSGKGDVPCECPPTPLRSASRLPMRIEFASPLEPLVHLETLRVRCGRPARGRVPLLGISTLSRGQRGWASLVAAAGASRRGRAQNDETRPVGPFEATSGDGVGGRRTGAGAEAGVDLAPRVTYLPPHPTVDSFPCSLTGSVASCLPGGFPFDPSPLRRLRHLTVAMQGISRVPESLGLLTELTELCLSSRELTHLPASIGCLTHLSTLILSGCGLGAADERETGFRAADHGGGWWLEPGEGGVMGGWGGPRATDGDWDATLDTFEPRFGAIALRLEADAWGETGIADPPRRPPLAPSMTDSVDDPWGIPGAPPRTPPDALALSPDPGANPTPSFLGGGIGEGPDALQAMDAEELGLEDGQLRRRGDGWGLGFRGGNHRDESGHGIGDRPGSETSLRSVSGEAHVQALRGLLGEAVAGLGGLRRWGDEEGDERGSSVWSGEGRLVNSDERPAMSIGAHDPAPPSPVAARDPAPPSPVAARDPAPPSPVATPFPAFAPTPAAAPVRTRAVSAPNVEPRHAPTQLLRGEARGAVPNRGFGRTRDSWCLPPSLASCPIERLELVGCGLAFLPSVIPSLESLRDLSLGCNRLTDLGSDSLHQLQRLSSLSLFDNDLRAVPANLEALTGLETLHLDANPHLELDASGRQRLDALCNLALISAVKDAAVDGDIESAWDATSLGELSLLGQGVRARGGRIRLSYA